MTKCNKIFATDSWICHKQSGYQKLSEFVRQLTLWAECAQLRFWVLAELCSSETNSTNYQRSIKKIKNWLLKLIFEISYTFFSKTQFWSSRTLIVYCSRHVGQKIIKLRSIKIGFLKKPSLRSPKPENLFFLIFQFQKPVYEFRSKIHLFQIILEF